MCSVQSSPTRARDADLPASSLFPSLSCTFATTLAKHIRALVPKSGTSRSRCARVFRSQQPNTTACRDDAPRCDGDVCSIPKRTGGGSRFSLPHPANALLCAQCCWLWCCRKRTFHRMWWTTPCCACSCCWRVVRCVSHTCDRPSPGWLGLLCAACLFPHTRGHTVTVYRCSFSSAPGSPMSPPLVFPPILRSVVALKRSVHVVAVVDVPSCPHSLIHFH